MHAKRFYYILKLFGLAPMSLKVRLDKTSKKPRYYFLHSNIGIAYNVFLAILYISLICFSIWYTFEQHFRHSVKFEKAFDTFHVIFSLFISNFVQLVYCFKQDGATTITSKLSRLCYSDFHCNTKWIVLTNLATLFVTILSVPSNYKGFFVFHGINYLVFSTINFTFLQYAVVLKILHKLFQTTNERIIDVLNQPERRTVSVTVIIKNKCDTLSDLRSLYLSLCELSEQVSNFYSIIMLFCVAHLFDSLIVFSYYVAKPLVMGTLGLPIDTNYLHCLFLLIHELVLLLIFTKSAQDVVDESKKTGDILSRRPPSFEDPKLQEVINHFSQSLIHKNVLFVVYGFFTLDQSLLTSIVGSITTYLVILLQFQYDN